MNSRGFRRVGITGISLQPSVFRLHAAHIDFNLSLLKCTINQYSNKSSFILEKCTFQLSGYELLVLSMLPEGQLSACDLGPPVGDTFVTKASVDTSQLMYSTQNIVCCIGAYMLLIQNSILNRFSNCLLYISQTNVMVHYINLLTYIYCYIVPLASNNSTAKASGPFVFITAMMQLYTMHCAQ